MARSSLGVVGTDSHLALAAEFAAKDDILTKLMPRYICQSGSRNGRPAWSMDSLGRNDNATPSKPSGCNGHDDRVDELLGARVQERIDNLASSFDHYAV